VTRRELLALGVVAEEEGRRDWDGGRHHVIHVAGDVKSAFAGVFPSRPQSRRLIVASADALRGSGGAVEGDVAETPFD
jgi:hypothetical protein